MSSEGNVRASDTDRDQVAEVLHTAYAEGRISLAEHEERVSAALTARTFDDLTGLTADLVPMETPAAPPQLSVVPGTVSISGDPPGADEPDRITAVLAESNRQGSWSVHKITYANVLLGSVTLDLTEATFPARTIEVSCTQLLGQITIRVPLGTTVRMETANVLGDTSVKHIGEPDPSRPTVVVRGTNILGEVSVRGPKRASLWRRRVA